MLKNNSRLLGCVLPLAVFVVILVMWNFQTPMITDEYCFYKLSLNFPNYSSTSDWFLKDRPSMLNNSVDWDKEQQEKAFREVYDSQLYPHSPLMPIVFSPIVKGLNWCADKGIILHIEDEDGYDSTGKYRAELITKILRMFSIITVVASMWLIYELLYKKVGKNAYLFAVPLAASYQLLFGAFLFYWDVFMMFFFVLTLYLMERKSKWAYVTACFMLNTKMFIPFVIMLPLVVKNWKMIFTGFAILPWFIVAWIVTGDPIYFFTHYFGVTGTHNFVYHLYSVKEWVLIFVGLGIPLFAIMTLPIIWYAKKYPEYVALLVVACLYAFTSGLALTHLSTLLYAGCLIFPIVVYEYKLTEKINRWFRNKKDVVDK
jgi:hypothetical protein